MERSTITHEDGVVYEFGPVMDPIYEAADGESLTIETVDSLEGAIQKSDDLLHEIPSKVNAATGPIAIDGASAGDLLAVDIEAVRITEDRGRVITAPGFGLLQDHADIEHPATRITPVDDDANSIQFEELTVPIDPVIGTIGVATAAETYSTLIPHDHGGNLDTTDMTAGVTAFFPVFQPGGMLALGDAKAVMADGEMCGTGAEIGMAVDLTVSVIEDAGPTLSGDDSNSNGINRPMVTTEDMVKTIASAETLEDAAELANRDMVDLLSAKHDFTSTEAYLFSSLVGGLEISQVVDPLVTVRNAVPREFISPPA